MTEARLPEAEGGESGRRRNCAEAMGAVPYVVLRIVCGAVGRRGIVPGPSLPVQIRNNRIVITGVERPLVMSQDLGFIDINP